MSETATAVRSVTGYGVTLTSAQTPEQRFAAIAKSMNAPVAQPAHVRFAGPEGHPHVVVDSQETAQQMVPGSIAGKAPPPTPKQLEAANKPQTPAEKIAAFDAEQRAAGKQITPGTAQQPRTPDGKFSTAAPGWQSHVEDGEWVGLENLNTNDTSGYTIPQWVTGQRVHVSVMEQLKDAKAAGITQAQVNTVFGSHARRNGWVKT